jgi:hypothetical protein
MFAMSFKSKFIKSTVKCGEPAKFVSAPTPGGLGLNEEDEERAMRDAAFAAKIANLQKEVSNNPSLLVYT